MTKRMEDLENRLKYWSEFKVYATLYIYTYKLVRAIFLNWFKVK